MKIKLLVVLLSIVAPLSLFAETVVTTKTTVVSATPVVDTAIYASGDLVGGKLTLSGAAITDIASGVISNVVITDLDKEAADLDIVFFSADPTGTTFTDQAAFDIADTDLSKVICTISVTTDVSFNDNGISYANNQNCPFKIIASSIQYGTTLYAAIVSRGTPTYTSASDLTVKVGILQD